MTPAVARRPAGTTGTGANERVARARVAVLTTVLPEYKVHLYQRLSRQPGWDLMLWHGPARADMALPDADPGNRIRHRSARNLHFRLGVPSPRGGDSRSGMGPPVVWQRVWRELWDFQPDVIIVDEFVRVLSSWPILLEARRRGVPTILYGHGENRERHAMHGRLFAAAIEGLRGRMHRLASALIVYTEESARDYRRRNPGTPCFYATNTLDTDSIAAELAKLPRDHAPRVRATLGVPPGALLAISVGRMVSEHDPRPQVTAVAAARRAGADVHLCIVGGGPLEGAVRAEVARLDPTERGAIHLMSRRPLPETTQLLAGADVAIAPGTIGLAVVHAFAAGIPFLAAVRDDHAPEEVYLRHGENGLWLRDEQASLTDALVQLHREPEWRRQLAEGARAYARDRLAPDRQARGFIEAVKHVMGTTSR